MILTDYFKAIKVPDKKTPYNIVHSSRSYDYLENLLRNSKGGQTLYIVDRPNKWGDRQERKSDKAITKASINISSIIVPDPKACIGFGDINGTTDSFIIIYSPDWSEAELFIARGQKNNSINLYHLAVEGELDDEILFLRNAVQKQS